MSEEHKQRTREMIAVMQAYVDGQDIECVIGTSWLEPTPGWDWSTCNYRIATASDTIDWSHVAPEWKWMARERTGPAFLYIEKPSIHNGSWYRSDKRFSGAFNFASYKRGTVDWKDSLVERPAQ